MSPRRSSTFLLTERVKELNCLYMISRAFDKGTGDLPRALQMVADALPPAWQYPEIAAARITYREAEYTTPGFRVTPWMQECPLLVEGCVAGSVAVSYLEERPACGEGPFLIEERTLLNAVAQRLGIFIEREFARDKLLEYQEDLRSLAAELTMSEQRERRRLAEVLHDRIGQNLAVLSLKVAQARQVAPEGALRGLLDEVQDLVQMVIGETRSATYELCPPILYELGLGPALEWLADDVGGRLGLDVVVRVRGALEPLRDELRVTLFQAVRELLTNVAKHAKASVAEVVVHAGPDDIQLSVQDDGVGMSDLSPEEAMQRRSGFGLFNIRERLSWLGGDMRVSSHPDGGTLVVLTVPRRMPSSRAAVEEKVS